MELDLRSDDLDAATRAMKRAARDGVPNAIAGTTEELSRATVQRGKGAIAAAPGRWPKARTAMRSERGQVVLAAPWAGAANYGKSTHVVFGKVMSVGASPGLSTLWGRPVTGPGYIMGPAIEAIEPKAMQEMADAGLEAFSDEFDKAGVPRG